jgi:hypothetical protein
MRLIAIVGTVIAWPLLLFYQQNGKTLALRQPNDQVAILDAQLFLWRSLRRDCGNNSCSPLGGDCI